MVNTPKEPDNLKELEQNDIWQFLKGIVKEGVRELLNHTEKEIKNRSTEIVTDHLEASKKEITDVGAKISQKINQVRNKGVIQAEINQLTSEQPNESKIKYLKEYLIQGRRSGLLTNDQMTKLEDTISDWEILLNQQSINT